MRETAARMAASSKPKQLRVADMVQMYRAVLDEFGLLDRASSPARQRICVETANLEMVFTAKTQAVVITQKKYRSDCLNVGRFAEVCGVAGLLDKQCNRWYDDGDVLRDTVITYRGDVTRGQGALRAILCALEQDKVDMYEHWKAKRNGNPGYALAPPSRGFQSCLAAEAGASAVEA